MTSVESIKRLILRDALGLAASYLAGPTVALGNRTAPGDSADDLTRFVHELRVRHALASASQLLALLPPIERRLSSVTRLQSGESRGVIRGRLDFPRYLARRGTITYPRLFPIVTTEQTLATPENRLVRVALGVLRTQLAAAGLPARTAEGLRAVELQQALWQRETGHPWREVASAGAPARLLADAASRVRRRRTGNDVAYAALVSWAQRWIVDLASIGTEDVDVIVDGLLAFPAGEQWWDRVFELWVLRAMAESFTRRGWTTSPPVPLHEAGAVPIYTARRDTHEIALLFQRALFAGHRRWRYTPGGELRGIFDVVCRAPGGPPLIVDAKFRWAVSETRSEETFKMLGYAENQRSAPDGAPFVGLLLFPGPRGSRRTLVADEDGGRLDVIVGDLQEGVAQLEQAVDIVTAAWLGRLGLPGGES
jgi:hypothetical protein